MISSKIPRVFTATFLCVIVSLSGCMSMPAPTKSQLDFAASVRADLDAQMRAGRIRSIEQWEIQYAKRLCDAIGCGARDYSLFLTRIDIGKRADRGEISHSEYTLLIDVASAKWMEQQRQIVKAHNTQVLEGLFLVAVGTAAAVNAASTPRPMMCTEWINGRYISFACY